jgi:PilZ domain
MSHMVEDRRASPRHPLILVAVVEHVDRSTTALRGRTSDVSRGGCFIDALNPMSVGTKVRIRLQSGHQVFETTGSVASVDPGHGMGVEFNNETAANQLAVLDGWLATGSQKD